MKVTAHNDISHKTSESVRINVVERLSAVRLEHKSGEPVIGHELGFLAQHYAGSNATYYWAFGDGRNIVTRSKGITHTFTK